MSEKLLKLKTKDQNIWFTGCTHFFHEKSFTWQARGFSSIQEHKDYIIAYINNNVKENDILFHLGDITLNCKEQQFEELIDSIQCKNIYLLAGNHNNPFSTIYKREISKLNLPEGTNAIYPYRYKNILYFGSYLELWINNIFCVLSHYPIAVWNYAYSTNCFMLHSHNHGNFKDSLPTQDKCRRLDVGVDVALKYWNKPILNFNDIHECLMPKPYAQVLDHHNVNLFPNSDFVVCPETGLKEIKKES